MVIGFIWGAMTKNSVSKGRRKTKSLRTAAILLVFLHNFPSYHNNEARWENMTFLKKLKLKII